MDDAVELRSVYHASSTQGLKVIAPRQSTHGQPWVYATTDIALAALFICSNGGDLSCSVGYLNGQLHICERWPGAFDELYDGRSGSIYVLAGQTFRQGMTSFAGEVVSEMEIPVLDEILVADAKKYIVDLQTAGRLTIYRYPDRPSCYPVDDQDLVNKAVSFSRHHAKAVKEYLERHHPHLLQRVQEAMNQ